MWIAPIIAFAAVIYLTISSPDVLAVAGPVLGFWFASPAIAWWISRPLARRGARLTDDQTIFLRKISRKTWAFFETFVGPEDHWLPPDNYQDHPVDGVAHRTSPTNMGLALLANLSAYDFGYISSGQLIERTANALRTMEALERYRGHFYNWYDTQSLKPLQPMYISTVDSGNLAAHLLTLRPGLLSLPDQKILEARFFDGLGDTLKILMDAAEGTCPDHLAQLQKDLDAANNSRLTTLADARLCLDGLMTRATEVLKGVNAEPDSQVKWWALAFVRQCQDAIDETDISLTPRRQVSDHPDEISHAARTGRDIGNQPRRLRGLTAIERLPCNPANYPIWSMTSSSTRHAICWPLDTTSLITGGTRVTTICWPRKRDYAISWRLRRDNCRRRAGLPWVVCSLLPVESRFSFRGAVRCSSTSCHCL